MRKEDVCERCKLPYSFIRARFTDGGTGKSYCLECGEIVLEELKLSTVSDSLKDNEVVE